LPRQSAVILFNKIQCSTFVFGAKDSRAMALLAQHKPHQLTMTIQQLLSLLLLFSVTNMNLTSPRKQRHIKKVALASTVTLLRLLESRTAESIVFVSLLQNKRVKQGHSPTTTPVTCPTWSELTDDLTR
jgi:hypothetical protein